MSSVDDRVVNMSFNNAQFEQGIKHTLASLEALNKSLRMENAAKGFQDIHAASQSVKLGHIAEAVDGIAHKFKAMSIVAITALATIAHQATIAGLGIARGLTIDPIKLGLQEYQTNINSIQTILSNTRWQNTGLEDVNEALQTLNDYSDKTIYNFAQMARNIGTFTAAGVKLEVATSAIKGIANLAAVSGSSAEQASTAMYQLSQAIATGTVKLIDWNSVVNAGMGGKVFQDALMRTARTHGVAIDQMLKDAGSFRATLEKGWLSSQILTETLAQFTGDMTQAQLISMGYTKQQAVDILAMGKDAQDAATKVKTVSQLFNTLKETATSGWAKTWQLIFGDFEEARTLFTNANDTIGGFIKTSADMRNKVVEDWKALGGRTVAIEAIAQAFNVLMEVIHPIKLAFRDMFPAMTGKRLYDITVAIRDFFSSMKLGEDTMDNIRRTAAGFFAIFGIGFDILKQVGRIIFELFNEFSDGEGSILSTTATVGDFLVALREAIQNGEGLIKFFNGVKAVIRVPILLIQALADILGNLFDRFDPQAAGEQVANFAATLGPLGVLADFIAYAWRRMGEAFMDIISFFGPLADKLTEMWQEVAEVVGGVDFGDALAAINTGALVAFVAMIKTFAGSFGRGGLTGILGSLTSTLSAMQTTLQAATLLQIAAALLVLAIAISMLSKIDSEGLTKALSAIAVMFTQLLAGLAVLTQLPTINVARMYVTAASLIALSLAILILSQAVKSLSELSWEELAKGLVGVVTLLNTLALTSSLFPAAARMTAVGLGMIAIAFAIKILASAVKDLSGLDWEEMAKGLVGVAGLLLSLGIFSRIASVNATGALGGLGIVLLAAGIKILASAMKDISGISWENVGKGLATLAVSLGLISAALILIPPTAPLSAAGVAIVAAALLILAQAIESISGISWENVGKGMATLAASLVLISAALILIPPTAPLSAAGVLIVAVAIGILAKALQKMGSMSWEEIAKGLTVLAGSLIIITAALLLLPAALPGAAALFIVSAALVMLAAVMKTLAGMSWGEIAKGLGALALAFTVLGIAAAVLSPVIPSMLGLGAALFLIGAGLALVGVGVFLFATGLTALSVAGAGAAAAITAIVSAIIGMVPVIVKQVGIALLMLIEILIDAVPKIVELILDILIQVLQGMDRLGPQILKTLSLLLDLMLALLQRSIPKMVRAGLNILIGVLAGIRDNIGRVVTTATDVIVAYLNAIGKNLPRVIQAGVDLLLAFINGITKAIRDNDEKLGDAGADMALAIVEGCVKGFSRFGGRIRDAAIGVAKDAWNSAMDFLGIGSPSKKFIEVGRWSAEGFAKGLTSYSDIVKKASRGVSKEALASMKKTISGVSNEINDSMDLSPTIRPVLDLSSVRRNAALLDTMLTPKAIDVNTAYIAARQVSDIQRANEDSRIETDTSGGDTFNYNQYNTSPKALSSAEIYRQTKNQLSTAKGGLP